MSTELHPGVEPIFVQPRQVPSTLDDLTVDERAALNVWSSTQQGDFERGGAIDAGAWPGWDGVIALRFKARFGVELPTAGS